MQPLHIRWQFHLTASGKLNAEICVDTNFFPVDQLRVNDLAVEETGTLGGRQNEPQEEAQLQNVVERKPV